MIVIVIASIVGLLFVLVQQAGAEVTIPKKPILTPQDTPSHFGPADLYYLAVNAGFTADDAVTAAAIAIAESSGNPRAYNPEKAAGAPDGMGSFGLWQIYRYKHPEFADWDLYNPQQNAAAAYSVFKGAGKKFRPWSTFTNLAYQAHVQTVTDSISV